MSAAGAQAGSAGEGMLRVRGARHNNLKNIDVDMPKYRLVVISGLSGSGKSTLAFDTIYAEGQRRYVESLSAYARQFLEMMDKPDVNSIEGLSPAISIQQKTTSKNPRSTVGTTTEIYDYMRLLFARIGTPHCTSCGREISTQSVDNMCDTVLRDFDGDRILVMAPIVRHKKGTHEKMLARIKKDGYSRARVDGEIVMLGDGDGGGPPPALDKQKWHNIEIVVDRMQAGKAERSRLFEAIQTAIKAASGSVVIAPHLDGGGGAAAAGAEAGGKPPKDGARAAGPGKGKATAKGGNAREDRVFSQNNACPHCGVSIGDLEPRVFSFNSPFGMCNTCNGLGMKVEFDPDLVIPDRSKSLLDGAIVPWEDDGSWEKRDALRGLAKMFGFSLRTPFTELAQDVMDVILYGTDRPVEVTRTSKSGGHSWKHSVMYEGVVNSLHRQFTDTSSESKRDSLKQYMRSVECKGCGGAKLRPEPLAVRVGGRNIMEVCDLSIEACHGFFAALDLDETQAYIAQDILKEIRDRLEFLKNVGLNYLSLNRLSSTLSGGESQRIRLATQIGSNLTGVLYVLDEPTIGLHQRDNTRLINTLHKLRDLGNTVIVVEHDEDIIRNSDWIVDLGPGAGVNGGNVVFEGDLKSLLRDDDESSVTGRYLRDSSLIVLKDKVRKKSGELVVRGAAENNLKNISVTFPLGLLVAVTGVSGSGKSTLVNDILLKSINRHFYRTNVLPGQHKDILGVDHLDKVIAIDQSPIGRTPRSNPATYIGVFSNIRELFASTEASRERGYTMGRFSFNVPDGRCFACEGDGVKRIEMQFLSDVFVKCDECAGKRYNTETLSVLYKGRNIADVLGMTVDEALRFFENIPPIKNKLQTVYDVGLGYIKLGQSSTTLSGGEAQRVKLATELSKRGTGRTFYILDEPTTGLHFADVQKLLKVLNRLVNVGNTVVVIEHNMDVIKNADWLVDLGPEGGDGGGAVVACGTPEQVAQVQASHTGTYLKMMQLPPDRGSGGAKGASAPAAAAAAARSRNARGSKKTK